MRPSYFDAVPTYALGALAESSHSACCDECAGLGDLEAEGTKAAKVASLAAAGAAAGSVVPVFGTAAGAAAGAIYGAITQYGDRLKNLFSPKAFTEDDYNRHRQKCAASGGKPNPGVAPDNYGGCIYADGSLSGGDWPFPGSWNGEIRDRAAFDRARAQLQPAAPAQAPPPPRPIRAPMPRVTPPRSVAAAVQRRYGATLARTTRIPSALASAQSEVAQTPPAHSGSAVPYVVGAAALAAVGGGAWFFLRKEKGQ